jgi:hypothetical protein
MLKPEAFFSFGGGGEEASLGPGCGDAGARGGTGGGATAVECLPFRSACFFPFTLASPLRELIPCRFVAHLITAWHEWIPWSGLVGQQAIFNRRPSP